MPFSVRTPHLQRMTAISSDGCRIAYWTGGNPNGVPIVFLHGFSLDHRIWLPVFSADFLSEYYVIVPDLRGHGASDRPLTIQAYLDPRLWADDFAAILHTSNVQQVAVVAWSYGGRFLLDYVKYYGTHAIAYVNLVAAASVADPEVMGAQHSYLQKLCSTISTEVETAEQYFIETILGLQIGTEIYDTAYDALSRVTPQQRAILRQKPLDYEGVIAKLQMPVLISHGAADRVVLPILARKLVEMIPHANASYYPNVGHAVFLEKPDRFISELRELLA